MFAGSYTALVTPFRNNEIDEDALRKLVDWQIKQGSHGLVPTGTTGESATLSEHEHKRVIEIVVKEAAGRVPVIAGAGSNNPVEALTFAQTAQQLGADAILCVAGYYNRPSQAGLYEHFKYIHDNTDIPMIVYNVPARTVVDVLPETMAKLALLPRIVGVKDATANLSRPALERALIKKEFSYLSGEDNTALAYQAMGGRGCISVTANVAPKLCAEFQNYCLYDDYKHALELSEKLLPLHQILFAEPNPSGAKYALSLLGICSDEVRLPLLTLNEQTKLEIRQIMKNLNLID